MKNRFALTLLLPCLILVSLIAGCNGGSGTPPPPPLVDVSISATTNFVLAGGTVGLTASTDDPANKGVTWSLSPASGAGMLTNETSTSATYNAPAAPPPSDLNITITATSVTNPSDFNTASITVPAITVTLSASVNPVEACPLPPSCPGGTSLITATVSNDPANKGVDPRSWTISPATGAGTLSKRTSTTVTYTAPATPPPSDVQVTITATSASDPTKTSPPVGITFAAIAVSLSANPSEVGATGTSTITAMVSNDPANAGVNPASWAISCPTPPCGTFSSLPTSTTVTYTAPPAPPASDVQMTISATSASDPTKSNTVTITFKAITVSLSANPPSVEATGMSTITATLNFDPANAGVSLASWAITSPAFGGGTLSGQTSTSVTYTAPSTPPTSDLSVTITASSVTDPTKSGSATVTVLAITVSVSPVSALIPVNITQPFTATVLQDPANKGVNWTAVQNGTLCSAACGAFAPSSTAIGAPTTYTAPSTVPADAVVMVTATSISDSTKSGSAKVKLTNGTVKLVPDSLDFGTVRVPFSKPETVTLTNTGKTALSISGITISGGPFSQTNTCGASVAAGASCTITVTFHPGTRGLFSATLSITDSSTDSPQKVALSGSGFKFGFRAVKSALATNKTVTAPSPTGANHVGTRVLHLVDAARNDPFLADGSKRELLVRFWYPATQGQACKRAEYTSPKVWSHFSELLGIPLPQVSTNSCWNTSMTNGTHPVVVFTHGYTGTFTDYTFLFEDLASRGYVVASVDHTFEATAVEFPDGRFAESVLGSYLASDARSDMQTFEFALSVRLADLKFVLNELERVNGGADPLFTGKLDLSSIAVAGHSLGGLTALFGIEQESRFKAGIILDGAMPDSSFGGTDTPVFVLAPGRDEWTDDERRLWGNLRGPRLAVNLKGAEHMTPSDAVWLAYGAIKTGTMGPEKTIAAIRSYVAAFLDAHLLGKEPGPLLTGPSSEFPDATLTTRKELLRAKY